MKVTRLNIVASERYPYTHRIEFSPHTDRIYEWAVKNNIPGTWALDKFYCTEETAMLMMLKWGSVA